MNSNSWNMQRRKIFKEISREALQGNLQQNINSLQEKFIEQNSGLNKNAVKSEFLMSMGLNPLSDLELADAVAIASNLQQIEEPLVSPNKNICEQCLAEHGDQCLVNCIHEEKRLLIEDGRCISCGKCIPRCPMEAISDKIEFLPLVKYLKADHPIYANVAPSIVGQFGDGITLGQIRSALKLIGFTDMVEVALFADILTLHEADQYNLIVQKNDDYLITSCCCPVWVNMINKHYPELEKKITKTVSPMIASGRVIKALFPEAITVFIGPCIAKKAEAKVPELAGDIDYVLTFSELSDIFSSLNINLASLPDDSKEQASYGGRIYGKTGGVSDSVRITVERIAPQRTIEFKAFQADGVKECKTLLDDLKEGKIRANFIEGMGCKGGCVGGPKRNIDVDTGARLLTEFSQESLYLNPIDNLNASLILNELSGIDRPRLKLLKDMNFDELLLRKD